jgi:hypothetical protein
MLWPKLTPMLLVFVVGVVSRARKPIRGGGGSEMFAIRACNRGRAVANGRGGGGARLSKLPFEELQPCDQIVSLWLPLAPARRRHHARPESFRLHSLPAAVRERTTLNRRTF